ncbi:DNA replication and repair protein RecO [Pontibacter ummariensis]|uniref:DNA repair protein RecO n=1 Tax=Pontibacter ummariensis TaxID=1610492 RepID=A0A239HDJ8_9BACT|nr:DNA repair protein RecO [Pontibacter ummariensis]PRY10635.1 DNA replication and repair protein RecO [Pontibacter ummariensis]SNS79440.1 DNA replication and repair protein RecO [Pontibacter ummariensis]
MLVKTRGIVLNHIKYRESSIITRVYTEALGVQSYIVNSVRKKGPGSRIALFQPFTLLDMVVYTSPKGGLTRISEYKTAYTFSTIPFDIRKSSMLLFLSEVVARSLKEEEENPPLFNFLFNAIVFFDEQRQGFENFHLVFLLQLSYHLGFGPGSGAEIVEQVAFSNNAQSASSAPPVLALLSHEAYFDELIREPERAVIPNGKVRRELLDVLIRYYQLHVDRLGEIKSLAILSEVLAG